MKILNDLKDISNSVATCLKCSMCTYGEWPDNAPLCPIYFHDKCFTHSAGGFMYIVRALLDSKMDYNKSMANLAFTCTGCGACDDICKIIPFSSPHASPSDIIRLLRYQLVKRNIIPTGKIEDIYKGVKSKSFFRGHFPISRTLEKVRNDKSDITIFAECLHSDKEIKIYESAFRVFEKMGLSAGIFSGEGCCGSTLYDYGFWDSLNEIVEKTFKQMRQIRGGQILFINPHCQEFVREVYPQIIPEYGDITILHISEFLLKSLKNGTLKAKKNSRIKVSYHDPCHLGRGLGIYDAPRILLSSLDGVELIEMERNRGNSFCCGARSVNNYFQGFLESTAWNRIEEFKKTKAELLVTACPYCKEAFQNALGADQKGIVLDLIEFVDSRTD